MLSPSRCHVQVEIGLSSTKKSIVYAFLETELVARIENQRILPVPATERRVFHPPVLKVSVNVPVRILPYFSSVISDATA